MVDQSVWRAGLPAPDYERIDQQVFNIIIHHTATPNTDTNYTGIVRDIYVYHTQVRGWSDIGYNYLIAPNGVIYKGRDPGIYDQDNVKGAHFCNANSGTMGISMIGTYTDVAPTDSALHSLIDLITWKVGKDGLDPLGTHWHPLNPELPTIAGHRDGCATECPGDKLYDLLDSIRHAVWNKFNRCGYTVSSYNVHTIPQKINVHTINDHIFVRVENEPIISISVYDLSGKAVPVHNLNYGTNEIQFTLPDNEKGIYILRTRTRKALYTNKLVLMP